MVVAERNRTLDLFNATDAVKGQVKARQQMAVLIDRQWLVHDGDLERSGGALIGGRSGSGKTFLARMMCRASGLPFAEVNATRYTEAGYAGLDLSSMFLPLIEQAAAHKDREEQARFPTLPPKDHGANVLERDDLDEVLEIAATGVILLDEFDKWMLRINHVTGQKDTAIQADLLKMIEGSVEYVSDTADEVGVLFDTSKVLILCAGAFVGLQEQVARRLEREFHKDDETVWDHIEQEDFTRFGMLPELAGRLATHIFLRPLRVEHLSEVLHGGVIEEYRRRFAAVGCEWAVSREGVQYIASKAIQASTGARAVDHIAWKVFGTALFEASMTDRRCAVHFEPMRHEAWLA